VSRNARFVAAVGACFVIGAAVPFVLLRGHATDPRDAVATGGGPAAAAAGGRLEIASLVLHPASAFFGETVTAEANVVATGLEDDRVAVRPDFRPYAVVAATREHRSLPGRRTMIRLRWSLQCLRTRCLAPDGHQALYAFPVFVSAAGLLTEGAFPRLRVVSRLERPSDPMRTEVLLAGHDTSSGPSVAAVSVVSLGLLGTAAVLLLLPARRREPGGIEPLNTRRDPLHDAIERAERRRVAVSRAEQRGALDNLAQAVGARDPDLAGALFALAWSEADPDDPAIAGLLERARRLSP